MNCHTARKSEVEKSFYLLAQIQKKYPGSASVLTSCLLH